MNNLPAEYKNRRSLYLIVSGKSKGMLFTAVKNDPVIFITRPLPVFLHDDIKKSEYESIAIRVTNRLTIKDIVISLIRIYNDYYNIYSSMTGVSEEEIKNAVLIALKQIARAYSVMNT